MKKLIFIVVFFLVSAMSFGQSINCEFNPKIRFNATYLITPNNKEIVDDLIKVDFDKYYDGEKLHLKSNINYNDSTKTLCIKHYGGDMFLGEIKLENAGYTKEDVYFDNKKTDIIKYTFYFYCTNKKDYNEFVGYKIPVFIICTTNDLTKTNKSIVKTYTEIKPINQTEYKIM